MIHTKSPERNTLMATWRTHFFLSLSERVGHYLTISFQAKLTIISFHSTLNCLVFWAGITIKDPISPTVSYCVCFRDKFTTFVTRYGPQLNLSLCIIDLKFCSLKLAILVFALYVICTTYPVTNVPSVRMAHVCLSNCLSADISKLASLIWLLL
jgi:hypothetical protein